MSTETLIKEWEAWKRERWNELTGDMGKAHFTAKAIIAGPEPVRINGVEGSWRVTPDGDLEVTVSDADDLTLDGTPVIGRATVPAGAHAIGEGRQVISGGADGHYGVIVRDEQALEQSGLTGIDAFPFDPDWVIPGRLVPAAGDRTADIERLTEPRTRQDMPAPADLEIQIRGQRFVLTVLQELPDEALVIFTDTTSGVDTPAIGRWLRFPLDPAGGEIQVDFNRATVSHHHVAPTVYTCPTAPAGNHLPLAVVAGERNLATGPATPKKENDE
ncbi:DUF1684 domain-containing protein [Plantibacter sp. VKM Ac-2885]|uniref:DUF1684 domain-containing protein n=1 Tax=Plantibacter sp. VKM Ac-2885 TaxID=2783828 RepID=UPI00188CA568|nr:DUF1684 domain-containing protein [Plantibacter sp. VKM Ac-2885]MBF4514089.1 DUF1684 domain-containing protein [Plantibacter sp. VKM Ac-2885]